MIAAIELAILARLRAIEPWLGFVWGRLDTLPDDWEAYLARKPGELRGPALAWIMHSGWGDTERENDQLVVDATFGLIVAHISARQDEVANRHGGPDPAKEPGSYRALLGATAALAGQTLGLDLTRPIEVGACQPLPRSKAMIALNMTAALIDLTCRFPVQLSGGDDPAALLALHANWDLPPFAIPLPVDADPVAPGVQLPDDDHATATDHLTFEEPSA
jgi:phage gp37-like protein